MAPKAKPSSNSICQLSKSDFINNPVSCIERLQQFYDESITHEAVVELYADFLAYSWIKTLFDKQPSISSVYSDIEPFFGSFNEFPDYIIDEGNKSFPFNEFVQSERNPYNAEKHIAKFRTYLETNISYIQHSFQHGDTASVMLYPKAFTDALGIQFEKDIPKELLSKVSLTDTVIQKSMMLTANDLKSNQTIQRLSPVGLQDSFEDVPVQQNNDSGKYGFSLPSCIGRSSVELSLYRTNSVSLNDTSTDCSFAHASESVDVQPCNHMQALDKLLLESDNSNASPFCETRVKIHTYEDFANMFSTLFSENSNILASRSTTPQKRQTAKPVMSLPAQK